MNIFGDLERLLAELWPFRIPIGIGLIVILGVFLYIAWRRKWYQVALDHPRTSIVVVLLVIVIGGPIGWVLGSPIFTRTVLVEEPPAVAAVEDGPEPAGQQAAGSGGVLLSGEFSGADSFHFGEGTAEIIEVAPGQLVLSLTDFSVLNGPDLFVYISPDPDGWTPEAVNLGGLKATDGSFSYALPEGTDPADIGSAIIWCRAFSVLFASAPLEPATA